MAASHYSVLVLGLDGATFDLMLPWIEQGHLPCLAKLLKGGTWGRLRSTIPPITPCAWSSFMTGKNPGKHGLFDFVEPEPDGYGFRFTNAGSRRGESLWGYLSRHGRRVGVMNVPMTYPPEPVEGYLISGLDTPHEMSRYMYPESVRQELRAEGIDYRIDPQHLGNMRSDALRDHWLRELQAIETVRTRAFRHLSRQYPSDFRMLVYTATDQVQHHFWHYMDEHHDKYDARGARKYAHAIRDVYIHIDRQIASVLEELGDDTVVVIMSDHGFGPASNVRLRLNRALAKDGLLRFADEGRSGRALRGVAGTLDRVLRATLSPRVKRTLAGLLPRLRTWFENLDEAKVDWDRTTAYANEAYRSSPSVWVNRKGRQKSGTVSEGPELDEALRSVEEALKSLHDPKTGGPAISHVYRARDVYQGPLTDTAPDLLVSWWEDGFLTAPSRPDDPEDRIVERSRDPVVGGVEFAGTHRLDGVFIMAGGPTRAGLQLADPQIIDLAPTVLYLMGLPIPGDMDGRPLLEALAPEFVAENPPRFDRDDAPAEPAPLASGFTEEEEELIAKRLQALGYID